MKPAWPKGGQLALSEVMVQDRSVRRQRKHALQHPPRGDPAVCRVLQYFARFCLSHRLLSLERILGRARIRAKVQNPSREARFLDIAKT